MKRLLLLLFVCALVVPRVAWGAHVSGHETIAAASEHAHHGDHSHGIASADPTPAESDKRGAQGDHGLVHNHVSADILSAMATREADDRPLRFASARPLIDRRSRRLPSADAESLLRPPRTI